MGGPNAASLFATHGSITRVPRVIVLDHPRLERISGTLQADQASFFLGPDNHVERVVATGNVNVEGTGQQADQMRIRADQAELLLVGEPDLLRTATLTGNVHAERMGSQPMKGDAGRAILDFARLNQLQKAYTPHSRRRSHHPSHS